MIEVIFPVCDANAPAIESGRIGISLDEVNIIIEISAGDSFIGSNGRSLVRKNLRCDFSKYRLLPNQDKILSETIFGRLRL